MHIAFVLGTRPEIIKLSSLISACIRDGLRYTLIHTNQHYEECMDRLFFEELGLPLAHFNLGVGSGTAATQVAQMIEGIRRVLQDVRPDCVIVQGDTNSALAGGLAASEENIPVAHVEAGLRSFDSAMPEEGNRILLDHLSSYWFCPSVLQVRLLANEGIRGPNVHITGNTGNDAIIRHAKAAREQSRICQALGLRQFDYLLLTCHRPSNTDDIDHFAQLMGAVQGLADAKGLPVVLPVHPRLGIKHRQILQAKPLIQVIDPVGYLDMLALLQGAALVMTDSGGLQEEACVLRRPCLILRANTERPESLKTGGARLVSSIDADGLIAAAQALSDTNAVWRNPFGDGRAYRRILDILIEGHSGERGPPQSAQKNNHSVPDAVEPDAVVAPCFASVASGFGYSHQSQALTANLASVKFPEGHETA